MIYFNAGRGGIRLGSHSWESQLGTSVVTRRGGGSPLASKDREVLDKSTPSNLMSRFYMCHIGDQINRHAFACRCEKRKMRHRAPEEAEEITVGDDGIFVSGEDSDELQWGPSHHLTHKYSMCFAQLHIFSTHKAHRAGSSSLAIQHFGHQPSRHASSRHAGASKLHGFWRFLYMGSKNIHEKAWRINFRQRLICALWIMQGELKASDKDLAKIWQKLERFHRASYIHGQI